MDLNRHNQKATMYSFYLLFFVSFFFKRFPDFLLCHHIWCVIRWIQWIGFHLWFCIVQFIFFFFLFIILNSAIRLGLPAGKTYALENGCTKNVLFIHGHIKSFHCMRVIHTFIYHSCAIQIFFPLHTFFLVLFHHNLHLEPEKSMGCLNAALILMEIMVECITRRKKENRKARQNKLDRANFQEFFFSWISSGCYFSAFNSFPAYPLEKNHIVMQIRVVVDAIETKTTHNHIHFN